MIEVDLENPVFIDAMLHKGKLAEITILRDSRLCTTNTISRGDESKSYSNEVIIAYPARRDRAMSLLSGKKIAADRLRRGYRLRASQWVTLKFYDERVHLETLLTRDLLPWIGQQTKLGYVDKWHFLRYADPREHLRIRFRSSLSSLSSIVSAVYDLLGGLEFSVDCYNPETERYGGGLGMEICESVFMEDSWMAAEIIRFFPKDLAVKRWELSLGALDSMLNAGNVGLNDRVALFAEMKDGYARINDLDLLRVKQALDSSYRKRRPRIERIVAMSRTQLSSHARYESVAELSQRRKELQAPLVHVMSSLIHMHLNRVLGVRQSDQEVVVYDYLQRYYRSEIARAKTNSG